MSTKVNTNTEKKPSDMMMQYNFTKEQYKDCVVFFGKIQRTQTSWNTLGFM